MSKFQPIYDLHNAKLIPLLANVHNVSVQSVLPFNGENGINTLVELLIDRNINADGEVVGEFSEEDRYLGRSVEVQRFDLGTVITDEIKEALRNAIGANVSGDTDIVPPDELLAVLTDSELRALIVLVPDDVKLVRVNAEVPYYVLVAKTESLGYLGSVNLDVVVAPPQPETPWVEAGEITISGVVDSSGVAVSSVKYGSQVHLRLAASATKNAKFSVAIQGATRSTPVEAMTSPDGEIVRVTLPAGSNTGSAKGKLVYLGEDGDEIAPSTPIYIVNADATPMTATISSVEGIGLTRMGQFACYQAVPLETASEVRFKLSDDTYLDELDSTKQYPQVLEVVDLGTNPFELTPNPLDPFKYSIRFAEGVKPAAHKVFEISMNARAFDGSSSGSAFNGTVYVEPTSHKLRIKDPATDTWLDASTMADAAAIVLDKQTSLDVEVQVDPESWAPLSTKHINLTSATGENDITIGADGKINFGTAVELLESTDIELVIEAGLEAALPLATIGTAPALTNTYTVKITRTVTE